MEFGGYLIPTGHLSWYCRGVRSYPRLSTEAERALCYRWCDHHDISAAHQLVGSHLRLVVGVAEVYRRYGLPLEDLIGEGYVGMMRALCRFEPDRGVRFASYALWWVNASIQDYILGQLGLSPLNRIGVGDSEDDLVFLGVCGAPVAVAMQPVSHWPPSR